MKRLAFAMGASLGFVAGSWAGRGPFLKVESTARAFARRPEVRKLVDNTSAAMQQSLDELQSATTDRIEHVIETVRDKASSALHLASRDDQHTYTEGMTNILE